MNTKYSRSYILILILAALSTAVFVSGDFIFKEMRGVFYDMISRAQVIEKQRMVLQETIRLQTMPPDSEILMPVDGVRVSEVIDTWHDPRGAGRVHEGQDIFAPRGTFVRSATEGVVRRIGDSSRGGNHVFITGAGNRRYYYAHLDSVSPLVQEGDRVAKETIIGFVGNSGNARGTPTHLHFGVYTNRGTINPLPLLVDES